MREQSKATQSLNQNTSDVNISNNQNTSDAPHDLNLNLLVMFWTINKQTYNDHAMKD
jgi:hypothetical protein